MKNPGIKILGLMSGTSADGLSVALCSLRPAARGLVRHSVSGGGLAVIAHKTYPYAADMRRRILGAANMRAGGLSALNFKLGRLWAAMVRRFCREYNLAYKDISVVGSHGQTVCHSPGGNGHTLQIGEAAFIAGETGRPVVADLRPADMAAGGQGAPLMPFMDEYLFGGGKPLALQNIGGVGNIAFVGRGSRTSGFDTGPGNSLMDAAVSLLSSGRMAFDRDGRWAAAGRIDYACVGKLLKHPFFALKPPKSLDRSEFAASFLKKHFGKRLNKRNKYDVLATLNYFTAVSVAMAFRKFAPARTSELIVSGGGALNPVLLRNIKTLLEGIEIKSIAALGIAPLAKEPACFALLAWLALNGRVNHCPSATGARGPRILGKIIL